MATQTATTSDFTKQLGRLYGTYTGGFIGPLAVGWILDLGGGMAHATWAAAFLFIALLSVVALAVFILMRPRGLSGDRGSESSLKYSEGHASGSSPPGLRSAR